MLHLRPTKHRISSLEYENERLRQKCAQLATKVPSIEQLERQIQATADASDSPDQHPESVTSEKNLTQAEAPEGVHGNPSSLYHGPTSTYYDTPKYLQQDPVQPLPNADDATQNLLLAQTARQSKRTNLLVRVSCH